MHVLHLLIDVRTACTYCWCTYVYWRKKVPAAVSTYCRTYVPTAPTWYSRVTTGARTHPTYVLLHQMLQVHTYCKKPLYLLYVSTAVRTPDDVRIYLLLYVLPVPTASTYWRRTYVKKEWPRPSSQKNVRGRQGYWSIYNTETRAKPGENHLSIISGSLFWMMDYMTNMRVDSWRR